MVARMILTMKEKGKYIACMVAEQHKIKSSPRVGGTPHAIWVDATINPKVVLCSDDTTFRYLNMFGLRSFGVASRSQLTSFWRSPANGKFLCTQGYWEIIFLLAMYSDGWCSKDGIMVYFSKAEMAMIVTQSRFFFP